MTPQRRKMSEVMKEMSERLLRDPDGATSPEAAHVALMFANIAWNEAVGLGHDRAGYRSAWELIEVENPEMWSDFKSNDVDGMIDELVRFKQQRYPDDQRRILTCGMLDGKIRVEWLVPAAPGVDSKWEMHLFGLVRTGQHGQATQFLEDTRGMSHKDAQKKVTDVLAKLADPMAILKLLYPAAQSPGAKRRSPASKQKATGTSRKKRSAEAVDEAQLAFQEIAGLIDAFCREHLNDEYTVLSRRLAEKLARKRPSPLIGGKPSTWACGIVRTIGWVNFLHDKSQTPHMRLSDIDAGFGVSESGGAAKLAAIRKMLKIRQLDPNWTLPSRLDSNPMVWMLEVNGFMMDVRQAPREVQEIAFNKRLIPYIPADRMQGE